MEGRGVVFISADDAADIVALQMAIECGGLKLLPRKEFTAEAVEGVLDAIRELAVKVSYQIGLDPTSRNFRQGTHG
jgi:hypothetical protein